MGFKVIIGLLQAVGCLNTVALLNGYRVCTMRSEKVGEEAFSHKVQQTFTTSVDTTLTCGRTCCRDVRCVGMLVCPGVCHLFGVFNVSQSPVPGADYDTCDVYTVNRCGTKGFPDSNGYCRCDRGYGGPICDTMVQDSCYNRWQKINSVEELRVSSNPLNVQMKYISDRKMHSVNKLGLRLDNTWSQLLYQLNKSSWDSFSVNPTRIFQIIFKAQYLSVLSFSISGSKVSTSNYVINATWYVKTMTDGNPCLRNDEDIDLLRSKILNGSSLPPIGTLFIGADGQVIVGERKIRLGVRYLSDFAEYPNTPSLLMVRYSTVGYKYTHGWAIGSASVSLLNSQSVSYAWCTNDCWVKILAVDSVGKIIHGSTTQLVQALRSGHQLRIYIPGMAAAAKSVYIHGHTITACLEDIMEPSNVTGFDLSGTAQRKMVSSNGHIQTRRYTFESDTIIGDLQDEQPISWFVDTRAWDELLSVSGDGQTLRGSVADLRQKVLLGASVRIVVDFTDGVCLVVDPDHLEMSPDGHVAADVIYHADIQIGDDYNITFTPAASYHLWSAIITTQGHFRKYLYTYMRNGGQHQNLSSYVYRYTWFVQL